MISAPRRVPRPAKALSESAHTRTTDGPPRVQSPAPGPAVIPLEFELAEDKSTPTDVGLPPFDDVIHDEPARFQAAPLQPAMTVMEAQEHASSRRIRSADKRPSYPSGIHQLPAYDPRWVPREMMHTPSEIRGSLAGYSFDAHAHAARLSSAPPPPYFPEASFERRSWAPPRGFGTRLAGIIVPSLVVFVALLCVVASLVVLMRGPAEQQQQGRPSVATEPPPAETTVIDTRRLPHAAPSAQPAKTR